MAHAPPAGSLRGHLEYFERSPLAAGRLMCRMLAADRQSFVEQGLALLAVARPSGGYRRLVHLLVEHDILLDAICDRQRTSLEEAASLVRSAHAVEPLLDAVLLRRVLVRVARQDTDSDCLSIREILAVFDAAGFGNRLLPMLVQLLRTCNPQVRSKVALIFGRSNKQVAWALDDSDPRVRANAVESLWRADTPTARKVLWKAVHDRHNRVVGNAILGLLYLKEHGAVADLERAATHRSALFRATAAWVMGRSGEAVFLPALQDLLGDPDENVRRNAQLATALLTRPDPTEKPDEVEEQATPPAVPDRSAEIEERPPLPEKRDEVEDQPTPPAVPDRSAEIEERAPLPPAGRYTPIRGLSLSLD